MGGCVVEIVVVFFDILSMIALWTREPEEALLQDGVPPVPECQGETEMLLAIADAC
jgi:hypothetical protein